MKNTIKRTVKYLLLFVAVIMMIFVIDTEVLAAEKYTEGYYTYTVTDGEATIVDVDDGISGDVVIPETLGGYPVVSINNRQILSNVTSITIPASLKTIPVDTLYYLDGLKAFIVDGNNEHFSSVDGVLYNKNKTLLIRYPQAKEDVSYAILDDTIAIADEAFTFSKLESLYIPKSLSQISDNFTYSSFYLASIKNYIVDDENPWFISEDGVIYNHDKSVLVAYPAGREADDFVVPSTVKSFLGCNGAGAKIKTLSFDFRTQLENWSISFFYFGSIEKVVVPENANLGELYFASMGTIGSIVFEICNIAKILPSRMKTLNRGNNWELPENFIKIEEQALNNVALKTVIIRNPKCEIYDQADTIYEAAVIYGYENSTAQKYAQKYNRNFVALECDHTLNYKYVEANGCNNAYEHYECNCKKIAYDEEIPNTAKHPYAYKYVEATCTTDAYECYKCELCGNEKDKVEFEKTALGHSYTENIISYPNCNTVGQKQFYCTTCHTYKYETIPTNDEHIDNDNNGYCDRCNVMYAYTEGDYHYIVKDGKATIIYVDNTISGDIVIPSTLGGYPVVAIGDEAFIECYYLTSVTTPETVTAIGEACFAYCIALKEVVISENVLTIGEVSFAYCMSLEKLIIKNSETAIGEFVAYTAMTVADGYTIEEWIEKFYALSDAENNGTADDSMYDDILAITVMHDEPVALPTVTIYSYYPSTAKTYAEENGIKFEEITDIPTSGTCGNNSTWSFDSETGELVISGSGTAGLERDDNGNYIIPWESLKLNIKSLVVENGIEGIGGFENCVNLKVVTLADSIIVFGDEAFRNCSSLEEIKLPQSLTMIGAAAFCDCTSLKEVVIPDTVEYIYPGAFVKCFNLESVKLPSYLTCIEDDVFNYCYKLKHLEIPETVTKIDGNPFVCCVSLKEISIPAGVTTIEPAAFENCWALEDIYIYSEQLGLDNSLLGEISAYKGIEEYYGSTNKDQNITSYINVSLKYLSGDADVQETIEGIVDCIQKYEKPIYSETLTIHGYAGSNAETYANKNGIKFEVINENTTIADSNTGVEIEYDNSAFECEVELVVSEEEINANIVFGDEFESYKAYDISLVADGEKVQPNGYVTVKLPIPEGFNAETTVVYYVDDSGNKTKLESTTENGYIVFETNHFSEYVLVDESSRIEPPHVHSYTASITKEATCTENGTTTYTCSCGDSYNETIEATGHDFDGSKCKNCDYDKADTCGCNCHKGGFMGFIWKIINFFQKLFKSNQLCKCGVKHY